MSRVRMARGKAMQETVVSIGSSLEPIHCARVGCVVELGPDGVPRVDYEGNRAGPLAARTIVGMPPDVAQRKREVLLVFEGGDPRRPVVIGLLCEPGEARAAPRPTGMPVAEIDGRRLVLEGKDEVVLRCGEASITLRRNGRVVVRGAQIESRATGANKIRGGSVQIN